LTDLREFHPFKAASSPALQSYQATVSWFCYGNPKTHRQTAWCSSSDSETSSWQPLCEQHRGEPSRGHIPGEGTRWHHLETHTFVLTLLWNVSLCLGPGSHRRNHPTSLPILENTGFRELSEFETGLFWAEQVLEPL